MRRLLFGSLSAAVLSAAVLGSALLAVRVSAETPEPPPSPAVVADLRQQLQNGLRAVRPGDREYIEQVIQRVQEGKLSRGLINYVYKISLQKRPDYPLPYFQRLLRALAARQGVAI